jgi:Tfp pilus assembly ATPase PilU
MDSLRLDLPNNSMSHLVRSDKGLLVLFGYRATGTITSMSSYLDHI